jgi:NAD-dependent SIR2 family protein deacetylase
MGLISFISNQFRWALRICIVSVIVIVIVSMVFGFITMLKESGVYAQPGSGNELECLNCHKKTLDGHDKLGIGNEACWVCHYSTKMGVLHLADDTQIRLSDSSQLCAQCHQERYNAWTEGTHGFPVWGEDETVIPDARITTCADCHEPHQPQIVLLGITKPHPSPVESPPSPPFQTLIIVGTSLIVLIGIGVMLARRGDQQ